MGGGASKGSSKVKERDLSEKYKVGVLSGTHEHCGTGVQVELVLVGAHGRTPAQKLKVVDAGDTGRLHTSVSVIDSHHDFGTFVCAELKNLGSGPAADFEVLRVVVDKVVEGGLRSDNCWQRWVFPCYGYVRGGSTRVWFEGTCYSTPQTPSWIAPTRRAELQQVQKSYSFAVEEERTGDDAPAGPLPAGCVGVSMYDLPRDEWLPAWYGLDFKVRLGNLLESRSLSHLLGKEEPWRDLDPRENRPGTLFGELYQPKVGGVPGMRLPAPASALRDSGLYWADDAAFGRDALQGCHACHIQAVHEVPWFIQLPGDGKKLLRRGKTVRAEADAGKFFALDYRSLLEAVRPEGENKSAKGHVAPCFCLLYLNDRTKELLPIAINLLPHEEGSPTLTPLGDPYEWAVAKLHVRCADAHVHYNVSLYLRTVMVVEPFCLAMHRRLSPLHPLHALLRAPFRLALAKCLEARTSVYGRGGLAERIFSLGADVHRLLLPSEYRYVRFEELAFPLDLRRRGVEDHKVLPEYPWRDDGMLVWAALVDFVADYVGHYYPNGDAQVAADAELQAWWGEAASVGHYGLEFEDESIPDVETLVRVATTLLWTVGPQCNALRAGAYDAYGCPAMRPTLMTQPPVPPLAPLGATTFQAALPNVGLTATVACAMYLEGDLTDAGTPLLGEQPQEVLCDAKAIELRERLQRQLQKVEEVVDLRNKRRETPYFAFQPSKLRAGLIR